MSKIFEKFWMIRKAEWLSVGRKTTEFRAYAGLWFWQLWFWFPLNVLYVFGFDRAYIKHFRREWTIDGSPLSNYPESYHFDRKDGSVVRPADYAQIGNVLGSIGSFVRSFLEFFMVWRWYWKYKDRNADRPYCSVFIK